MASEYECIHCGRFDTGTTHWERCEKHPAHAAIRALGSAAGRMGE